MVLGTQAGGVLDVLHRLVLIGLGGHMGTGKQYVSWIHEEDFCHAIDWLISKHEFRGPVNLSAPNPVPNRELMATLRSISGKAFGLPATRWMLEIGAFFMRTETELIIKSRRVVPARLLESGFDFRFARLEEALADLLPRMEE
jgi:NAD dependent epimerase/dehydratase family enzyme